MVELIREVFAPHPCSQELDVMELQRYHSGLQQLWVGSIVRCTCGQLYRREDDQREGLFWKRIAGDDMGAGK